MDNANLHSLLTEMRDAQLRFKEDYRRIASEALAIQKQSFELQRSAIAQQTVAVEAQARHLRLYRRVLLVSGIVVAALVALVLLRLV